MTVSNKVRGLYNFPTMSISDRNFFTEGCKFRLFLENTGSTKIIIETIEFKLLQYTQLSHNIGYARHSLLKAIPANKLPNALEISLDGNSWKGEWLATDDHPSSASFAPPLANLLEAAHFPELEVMPMYVETINGEIKALRQGLYSCALHIEYRVIGRRSDACTTPAMYIVKDTERNKLTW